jgi:hypothetical protein
MYVSIKPAIILESDPAESEKESQENRYASKYGRIASVRENYD